MGGERDLIGRWKLASDARDSSGNDLHAANHGVAFHIQGPDGKAAAATFNSTLSDVRLTGVRWTRKKSYG